MGGRAVATQCLFRAGFGGHTFGDEAARSGRSSGSVWPGVAWCGPLWHAAAMVLSIAKIGVAHAEYYTSRAAVGDPVAGGAVSYYADGGDHAGVWVSGGGWSMSAGMPVTVEDLRAALSCRDPKTNVQLGRKYTPGGTYRDPLGVQRLRRSPSAFDLTYSVPKSISVAWALADEATRREIRAAFDLSVGAVVDYMQTHAVASRKGAGGVERVEVPGGAAVARFDHYTSRAGDPQLHAHLLWMNRVKCADGVWRTLDGRLLYRHLQSASMYGAAVLRAELSRRMGWSWDRIGKTRHAEIAGVPQAIIDHWSTRRRQVARVAQRKIRAFEQKTGREPTPGERLQLWNEAAVQTRQAKRDELGVDLHREWRSDAIALGYDPYALTASYRTAKRVDPGRYDNPEVLVGPWGSDIDAILAGQVLAVVEQHSVGIADAQLNGLVYSVINASPLMANPKSGDARAAVDAVFDDLRAKVCAKMLFHDGLWHSAGLIAAETAALSWLESDIAPAQAADPDVGGLSDDQVAAVETLLGSHSRGTVVVGPAGAGKTTMLARFATAVGHSRVVAVAPTAVAAAELGASLGVAADTVAKVVMQPGRIPAGAWVIVDEASQLATREMASLCGRAAAAGARLVLVGDYAQQGSVTAGGLFAAAARNQNVAVATLSELWRFSDPAEAAATGRLRVGDPNALRYHHRKGRVAATAHTEAAEVAGAWWQQHRDLTTLVSAPSQALATEINADIAGRRFALGETGPAVVGDGDRTIRIGDVITTRRNDRKLKASDSKWVRNGDRWVVDWPLGRCGLRAHRVGSDARVDLPAGYVDAHVELGYAVTHTRAQSVTVDAGLTIVGASTRLPEMYVGLTRGRHSNHLVVVTDKPSYDEDSPTEHSEPSEILATVLKRANDQRTTIDADQTVLDPDTAAAHLRAVADLGHKAPLPTHNQVDAAALLTARRARPEGTERDLLEQRVTAAINAWLAGVEGTDLYDSLTDTERAVADARLGGYVADTEPSSDSGYEEPADPAEYAAVLAAISETETGTADPDEWAPVEDYPMPDPDDLDDSVWGDDQPQPDEALWETATPATVPPPVSVPSPERTVPEPGGWLAAAQWSHDLGATWKAYDLAADVLHETFGTSTTQTGGFPPADTDNPYLMRLTRRYAQARYVGAHPTADALAALIAEVGDTPLRDLLAPHVNPGLVTEHDRQWAEHVRESLIVGRRRRLNVTLEALDNLREPIRRHAERVLTEGSDRRADPTAAGSIVEADRATWAAECYAWLDAGAQPADMLARWNRTDRGLGDIASGKPVAASGRRRWRTLPDTVTAPPSADTTDTVEAARRQIANSPAPGIDPNRRPAAGRHGDRTRSAVREATGFYHRQLLHSPEAADARRYLLARGITQTEWVEWELGWAPGQWNAVTGLIGDADVAIAAGLSKRSPGGKVHDRIRERIMFPIRDTDGHVAGFAGRTLNPDNPYKYLNTPATDLYNKSRLLFGLSQAKNDIARTGEAVIVEGYTDAIAAHRNGIGNAVAGGGTAFTGHHTTELLNVAATEVTIMFDGDTAGRAAARKAGARCAASGLPVTVVDLPAGKDPADMTAANLQDAYHNPLPHLWAEIRSAARQCNFADPTQVIQAITEILARAGGDPTLELIAAHQTAALLSVPLDTTLEILERDYPQHTAVRTIPPPQTAIGL